MKKIQLLFLMIFTIVLLASTNINTVKAAEISESKQNFILRVKDEAIENYKKYNILPSLTISQAILESGFGDSTLSKKANNLFGIKAYSDWKGNIYNINTREYVNGNYIYIKAKFKSYSSISESISDHSLLLSTEKYKSVRKAKDYVTACNEIYKCGYATAPNYSKTLINIIEDYKLYEYDKIAMDSMTNLEQIKSSNNITLATNLSSYHPIHSNMLLYALTTTFINFFNC